MYIPTRYLLLGICNFLALPLRELRSHLVLIGLHYVVAAMNHMTVCLLL